MYCDLMFTNKDIEFIRWVENLEHHCHTVIYQNKTKWFQSDLELHDIENLFTSSLKVFKSGKYYIMRTIIPIRLGICALNLYDEDENIVDLDNLDEDTSVLSLLEFQGIRCSGKNFQIDILVKQMMIIKDTLVVEQCLIKKKKKIENRDEKEGKKNLLKKDIMNKKKEIDKKEKVKENDEEEEEEDEDYDDENVVIC